MQIKQSISFNENLTRSLYKGVEDTRLLTGTASFVDDLSPNGCEVAVMLRSPHARAKLVSIFAAEARAMEGVTVILADDLVGVPSVPSTMQLTNTDGTPRADADWPILANGMVRYQGEIVACVVAPSRERALDAIERIQVEYQPLDGIVEIEKASTQSSERVHHNLQSNICFDWSYGSKEKSDSIFQNAYHVTRLTVRNNRIASVAIETRGAIGTYDHATDSFQLIAGTQNSHLIRRVLADNIFKVPREKIDVVTPDVGGGFGSKLFVYPEYVLVLWAARILQRPVKWIGERSEAFLSDTYGRDRIMTGELALTKEGRFLGLRADSFANLGAYLSLYGSFTAAECGVSVLSGVYQMDSVYARVRGIFTNSVPVDAYRGAGRPETIYLIERLVDQAATELGIDRAELRAKNLLGARGFPVKTASGLNIDSGNFLTNQEITLKHAAYDSFEARRRHSRNNRKLRGLGFAHYLETNGGFGVSRHVEPDGRARESAAITFEPDGKVFISVGTQSTGQPHATDIARLASKALGISELQIFVREGGTKSTRSGGGTGGSRSTLAFSQATFAVIDTAITLGRETVARELKSNLAEVHYSDGIFRSSQSNYTLKLFDLVKKYPELMNAETSVNLSAVTYPTGCHSCELEIDLDTGEVEILRYIATDDFGSRLNPTAVEGQVAGGVAQGIGQALGEQCSFDKANGQLLTGTLMDYAIPRASNLPSIEFNDNGSTCQTNSLGLKGCGESGTSAAPPTVMSAIIDALKDIVDPQKLQMPATTAGLWSLLQSRTSTTVKRP